MMQIYKECQLTPHDMQWYTATAMFQAFEACINIIFQLPPAHGKTFIIHMLANFLAAQAYTYVVIVCMNPYLATVSFNKYANKSNTVDSGTRLNAIKRIAVVTWGS